MCVCVCKFIYNANRFAGCLSRPYTSLGFYLHQSVSEQGKYEVLAEACYAPIFSC